MAFRGGISSFHRTDVEFATPARHSRIAAWLVKLDERASRATEQGARTSILLTLRANSMLLTLLLQQPEMIWVVVQRTPYWVWGVLIALLAYGGGQLRASTRSAKRAIVVPVGFKVLSVLGVLSAFRTSEALTLALAVWVVAAISTAVLLSVLFPEAPRGTRYLTSERKFEMPGSVLPLFLVLGIFLTKYYVNVEVALNPAMVSDSSFVLAVASAYGLLAGVFSARSIRLWRLARACSMAGPDKARVRPEWV
jgi:hypothetical protein